MRPTHDIPQHLFVGTVDGEPSCAPDCQIYDIWPKFLVMVLLQGAQHFVIDDTAYRIDAGYQELCTPLVFMLNVARHSKLRFVNDSTIPLRKIQISAPFPWIERLMQAQSAGVPTLHSFFSCHLAHFRFAPNRQILHLAEQLMKPPPSMEGEVRTLYRNSRALDIMCLACAALLEQDASRRRPQLVSRRQSEKVRDYVLQNIEKALTIEEIAREVGASISSVQRHFKESFGMTVFEFIRNERLSRACSALEQDGVTIAQAAYAAGYADPSNFTTAFKKAYGVPPKYKRR